MNDWSIMQKLIWSIAILIGIGMLHYIAVLSLRNFINVRKLNRSRELMIDKIMRIFFIILAILAVVAVWQVTEQLWMFLTGVVGIIAIGFFAVWSILSNIVAGLFLFLSDPFRIGDEIILLPDDVRGRIQDLKLLFVVIKDEDDAVMHIPNNLFFQRVIKKVAPHVAQETHTNPQ